ncbi:MAG: amidase [Acidimicrobiia bacterium]
MKYDSIDLIASLHKDGSLKIEDTISECLSKIQNTNEQINAVVWQNDSFIEGELERVNNLKRNQIDLPLLGVPIFVKEIDSAIINTENSWGNKKLKSEKFCDSFTSTSVSKLQNAGAIIIGKTNNPELALTVTTKSKAHGPCNNPLDLTRNSGGSSGGAAASVAAGYALVATGSDGGGSIRIPSACCGVFGFKPSRDGIDLGPLFKEFWGGLVCKGLISNNVDNLTSTFNVLSEIKKANTIFNSLSSVKFGFRLDGFANLYRVIPDIREGTISFINYLGSKGSIVSNSSPTCFDDLSFINDFLDIIAYNVYNDFLVMKQRSTSLTIDECENETQYFYHLGNKINKDQYLNACESINPFTQKFNEWFENYDFLVTPTIGDFAPIHGRVESDPENAPFIYSGLCFPANVAGLPSITIPFKSKDSKQPYGVQIIAKRNHDYELLHLAKLIESDNSDIIVTNTTNITS